MVTATAVPNIFTATLNTEHQLSATIGGTGTGTITSSTPLDGAGLAWFVENDVDSLIASADLGSTFLGWDGDTTSASDSLILTMDMPYTVQAIMGLPVAVVTDSALAAGVMGAAYNQTLVASGGSGSYVWSVVGGALPAGVQLEASTGTLTGVPAEAGDFNFTARATSVTLMADKSLGFNVGKPTLTLTNVLDELLTSATPLTADERRFLDLLGNANGKFDVGDLRAWLIDTGQLSGSVAASRAPGSEDEEESGKDDPKKDDSKAEGDKS